MLELHHVSKQYKAGKPVFSDVSIVFKPGTGIALTGPNGSGKTTFLRILSVNSFPTGGRVAFRGEDIHKNPGGYLEHVGLVHDEESLPHFLTGEELLEWVLRARKKWDQNSRSNIGAMFDRLSLPERGEQIGTYSTGMKKKTQIAAAFIIKPEILILDEPLRGLDQSTREVVAEDILQAKKENTLILMASHSIDTLHGIFDEQMEFPIGQLNVTSKSNHTTEK